MDPLLIVAGTAGAALAEYLGLRKVPKIVTQTYRREGRLSLLTPTAEHQAAKVRQALVTRPALYDPLVRVRTDPKLTKAMMYEAMGGPNPAAPNDGEAMAQEMADANAQILEQLGRKPFKGGVL